MASSVAHRHISLHSLAFVVLALAAGSATQVQGASVACRFTSATRTSITAQRGYADALVDIAAAVCATAAGDPLATPLNETFTLVASAVAVAVAEVTGQCSGTGGARLTVDARSRAVAQAEAVGEASKAIIAESGECDRCEVALVALGDAIEEMPVAAVAEARINGSFVFDGEPFTVRDVERVVADRVVILLRTITDEVAASAIRPGACGGSAGAPPAAAAAVNASRTAGAECSVPVSVDDIAAELGAVTAAGTELQEMACQGLDKLNFTEVGVYADHVGVAVAEAVTAVASSCPRSGAGLPCGISRRTLSAVAAKQAAALLTALEDSAGAGCECDLGAALNVTRRELQAVLTRTSTRALDTVCPSRGSHVNTTDFLAEAGTRLSAAVSDAILAAVDSPECSGTETSGDVPAAAVAPARGDSPGAAPGAADGPARRT